jgi:hypothetical protein
MYAAQIPRGLRDKIAAELSINVQLIGISLKEKPSDENRYSKLDLVVKYFEENGAVGTVENPQTFFRGTLPMRYGSVGDPELDIEYFGGELSGLLVGLVGSHHYRIGGVGAAATISPSVDPMVLAAASDVESWSMKGDPDELEKQIMPFGLVLESINQTFEYRPWENLEFLAVKLLRWAGTTQGGASPFLLGSPIFVATAPA